MCGSKRTLGDPIKYRTQNSPSKLAELKHTLMHKCTYFSASRLVHRLLVSPRSGTTRYHNALPNKISSDLTSYYLDGLMHSVFAESLNLSWSKDLDTEIHTIQLYIAEKYPVLIHCWGVYTILLLCWGIRYLINLLSYTQHYYIVVVYSSLLHCWAIPNRKTILR